ncbi:tetratricopeptide repeat protein [Nannocystaceae bacterium ST9]
MDPRTERPRDLIGDIHAQQRRKLFRRVALIVALFIALLLMAIGLKLLADRRERAECLEDARAGFARGTSEDLVAVAGGLETCLAEHDGDPELLGALALTRAQLAAEFGDHVEEAEAAVAALPEDAKNTTHDGELARVMLALDRGDLDEARERLTAVEGMDDSRSIAPNHEVWVGGMLAIADPEADLDAAIDRVATTVQSDPSISIQRLLVVLHMHAGDSSTALDELARAREQSRTHNGLAADEALYNALLRQKLPGVADVADQLLGGEFVLSERDRAHALLARGVVHVQNGEIDKGMELVDQAWDALPGWDKLSRALALEMAMEAGDGKRARKWIDEAGLRAPESDIYDAWVELVEGEVMTALADLAKLPQEHPRVALLQGLALVEQGRFAEADAWLARADKLLPGRIDVEVARARVEAQTGDPEVARRKLESLAEEEPFAPRAWTGLGEANLAVAAKAGKDKPDETALKDARRAFKLAIQRERLPAEAHLQVALLADRKRADKPEVVAEVLEQLAKAVEVNDHLPRYAERQALYMAEVGDRQAYEKLTKVVERQGIDWRAPLALARLVVDRVEFGDAESLDPKFDQWIGQAETLAAPARELELLRARALLLTDSDADTKAAETKLLGLLAINEADIEARVYYVRTLGYDRDKAVAEIRRGIQVVPEAQTGRFYCEWSTIMSRGAKRRPAAVYAQMCWDHLRADPNTPTVQLLRAGEQAVRMVQRDKRPKPAMALAKELTDQLPKSAVAWRVRADAELIGSKAAEAKASIEKALELDADDPLSHVLSGDLWMRFGRKDRAKESYETARDKAKGTALEKELGKELKKKLEGL